MRGTLLFLFLLGLAPFGYAKQQEVLPKSFHHGHPIPDIVVGRQDAPVKIVEYSSLTCHHCAHFHKTVLPVLLDKYIHKGKVQLVFRHFPIDSYALKASAIVVAAPQIRQFSLVNKLFETQERWMGENCIEALAHISGDTLQECQKTLADKALMDRVLMARLKAEKEMKVDATPTFVINGRVIDYAPSLQEVEDLITPYLGSFS